MLPIGLSSFPRVPLVEKTQDSTKSKMSQQIGRWSAKPEFGRAQ